MGNEHKNPLKLRGEVKLPQDSETPLTPVRTPVGMAMYLYVRSVDSVAGNTIGQDYVTFRYGGRNLVFAVCDGVGQSFMGDLAARLLGDHLVHWLWDLQKPADAESFSRQAGESLNSAVAATAQRVVEYELPSHLPPILVQALEMQRKYGSESMFVAGRLALEGDDPWVALCWLGDSPVAAIDIDGELLDLGPHGSTSERWNASTGIKGEVHTWVGSGKKVARVAGYTDGLTTGHVPTDADLAALMALWQDNPPADDASLFDVRLAYSPQTVGETATPDTERILALPAHIRPADTEPAFFTAEETRPIVVEEDQRTPVAGVEPIEAPPSSPAVEGWRPLAEPATSKALLPGRPQVPSAESLEGLSTQQQIQVWQQAALLGLTSAALAMMMLERLMKDQGTDNDKK